MRYATVIEKAESNHSAYIPDLPKCVATGETVAEVEREMHDAIRFHLDGMREDLSSSSNPMHLIRRTACS